MDNSADVEAFTRFYEATKDAVFRAVVLTRGGDLEGSEDAVAAAYEKAFLRWSKLTSHSNPTAWVIRTAINHRISAWRRQRTRGPEPPSTPAPHSGLDPALVAHIRALPKGQREVLALRVLLDFSTEETATALGVRQGTVKTQLHRALKALRAQLGTNDVKGVWL